MKSKTLVLTAAMLVAGLFISCPRSGSGKGVIGAPGAPVPPVQVTVTTDKQVYNPGETVAMTLTAKNMSNTTVKLTFLTTQRYDFAVSYQGKELWRWSKGKFFGQVVSSTQLLSGASLTYHVAEYKAAPASSADITVSRKYDLVGTLTSTSAYNGQTQFAVNNSSH
jgi:hypothetical protein